MRAVRRSRAGVLLGVAGSAVVLALGLAPAGGAWAAWTASGGGGAAAAATVMPTGAAPTDSAVGTSVTVAWTAAKLASGAAVAGYVVKRYSATNGTPATVGASCSGIIATTSCTESSVAAGAWVYTDTPVMVNWTGGESADSGAIVVP